VSSVDEVRGALCEPEPCTDSRDDLDALRLHATTHMHTGMATRRMYDVCILGGGPAGWAGAVRAWDLGFKVCLIERREGLGGAAVWGGAMGKHVMQEVRTPGQIGCGVGGWRDGFERDD